MVNHRLTFFAVFVFSFASFSYEIALARFLAMRTSNQVFAQALMIGIFLLGLGIGVSLTERLKRWQPLRALLIIEGIVILVAAISLPFLQFTDILLGLREIQRTLLTGFFALLLGALTGMEIPLFLRLSESDGLKFNSVLAVSYMGSLACSLVFPLVLWPALGLWTSQWMVLMLVILVSVTLHLVALRPFTKHTLASLLLLLLGTATVTQLISAGPKLEQTYLKMFYYFRPTVLNLDSLRQSIDMLSTFPEVEHYRSTFQDIDIVQVRGVQFGSGYHLFIDQRNQFGSSSERVYHESMVHGSVNLLGRTPAKVLIIGGGDGLLVRELVKNPQVQEITLVELDPMMIDLARYHPLIKKQNQGALENERVKVVIDDGFRFIRKNSEVYDLILIDLPYPYHPDLSRLYSTEFYSFCRRALKDDGAMVFDFPFFYLMSANEDLHNRETAARVLRAVVDNDFGQIVSFGSFESFMYAQPSKNPVKFDYVKLDAVISNAAMMNMVINSFNVSEYVSDEPNSVFKPAILETPNMNF